MGQSSGMDKDTLSFFPDHGLGVGHHGLLGKQNLYEHSTSAFHRKWPGVPKTKDFSTNLSSGHHAQHTRNCWSGEAKTCSIQ